MGKFINLRGKRFGRWVVNRYAKKSHWECECDCGTKRLVHSWSLTQGVSKSCGCLRREIMIEEKTTHGESGGHVNNNQRKTKEYSVWRGMKSRCYNKNRAAYPYYGGRSIVVCDRWVDNYSAFLEDMGRSPSKEHTLDRINSNGNYEPSNCRWATRKEQSNNLSSNIYVKLNGIEKTQKGWCSELGISPSSWCYWTHKGFTHDETLQYFLNKQGVINAK